MQCWKILRTKNSTRIFETFETKVIESHMYTWNFNMKPERSEKLSSFLATVAIFGFHVFIFKFRQSSLLTTNRFPSFPQEEFAKGEAEDMMEVELGWDEEKKRYDLQQKDQVLQSWSTWQVEYVWYVFILLIWCVWISWLSLLWIFFPHSSFRRFEVLSGPCAKHPCLPADERECTTPWEGEMKKLWGLLPCLW